MAQLEVFHLKKKKKILHFGFAQIRVTSNKNKFETDPMQMNGFIFENLKYATVTRTDLDEHIFRQGFIGLDWTFNRPLMIRCEDILVINIIIDINTRYLNCFDWYSTTSVSRRISPILLYPNRWILKMYTLKKCSL